MSSPAPTATNVLELERLRYLWENAADVLYTHDLQGRFTWFNRAIERVAGYTLAEALRLTFRELVSPDDLPRIESSLLRLLAGETLETLELELIAKDGHRVPVELRSHVLLDGEGRTVGVQGIARDISSRRRVEQALQASEDKFRQLVEQQLSGIYIIQDGRFVYVNPRFGEIFGHPPETIRALANFGDLVWPEDREKVMGSVQKRLSGEVSRVRYSFRGLRADGSCVEVEVHAARTLHDARPAVIGTLLDITERMQHERQLRQSEERYALAAQGANDGLWDWNTETNEVFFSERWKQMLGVRDEDVKGTLDEWLKLVHSEDRRRFRAELTAHVEGRSAHLETELRLQHTDGTVRWMLVRGIGVRGEPGRAYRVAGSQTDITERKQAEERLVHDALHDALTGLPNRALLLDRLTLAMARLRRRPSALFAVLFIDLDRFKVVNDSLGHMAGDQMLVMCARRLLSCVRPGDTVARFGGDEFAVLLDELASPEEAEVIASRLQKELSASMQVGTQQVFTTASIGVALARPGYARPEDLLRDADTAMYRAKERGRARHVIFDPGMHKQMVDRLQVENALRPALERGEFFLLYQPVVNLANGKLVGAEALVRWNHPQRGVVSPGEFIPVAEETGLILPLGEWVLREACKTVRNWQRSIPQLANLALSVNLSTRQFLQADLVARVQQALEHTGLDPSSLHLEITESVLMEGTVAAPLAIRQLKTLGVHVHLDDFGTGYSSLAYLHQFQVDALKIDRSFVSRIGQGEGLRLVRAIINLARDLGISVIAEGTETPSQVRQLCELNCDYAQGFFFSPPVNEVDFRALADGVGRRGPANLDRRTTAPELKPVPRSG